MIKRNTRLRREFIYRKSLEGQEREKYEKKRKVQQALEEGKVIPTELRGEQNGIRHTIELEDESTQTSNVILDDEYARLGEREPKVLVTTSRSPSSRLTQFAKELKLIFPNADRINRGSQVMSDLVQTCRSKDFTDIVIAHEHRGEPDGLIVCHLPLGPTVYFGVFNAVMRHDIEGKTQGLKLGTISEAYPHLIFEGMDSKVGERVKTVLKALFPAPKADSKRVMTFANVGDFISFRHHVYTREGTEIKLKECGPRFELTPYQIKLGTMDQAEARNEWVLRPYMTTARKRRILSSTSS